jgi:hypothetical protein
MDDRMLHDYRREPDPGFARDLRAKLRRHEAPRLLSSPRVTRVLAAACAVAIVAVLFSVPSVRVSAQAVLDLFRVRRFAAVEFKESRLKTLRSLEKEHERMFFDREEKLVDPGPPRYVPSRDAASSMAGFAVSAPSYFPEGLAADSIFVGGEGATRLLMSESKLRSLLDRLDIRDVTIPPGVDGKWIEVRTQPVVIQRFRSEKRHAALVQARSPEVALPAGWDVERLAEIGLRVVGLDAGEARRISRATDWRTTLLVPIPVSASTFRQVTVRGQSGLLIKTRGEHAADGREMRVLLWTQGDRVFCLRGDLRDDDILEMAESVS